MSLEFLDGFDHNNYLITRKWDASSGTGFANPVGGRFGGNGWDSQNTPAILTQSQLASVATRTVGFAFYPSTVTNSNPFFQFTDTGSVQLDLRIESGGTIAVTRNGTVLGTSTNVLSPSTWVYIEFQATIDSSVGAYTVKVWSGASPGVWLTATGVNTQATSNASMNGLIFPNVGTAMTFDDVYVLNSSGSANNTFLGECRILTSMPTGDDTAATGTNLLWTPSSGSTHYSLVNEQPPNDDTSYVSSSTPGQIDSYQFAAVTPSGAIAAVQVCLCERKDDVGTRTTSVECRDSGGTNHVGSNVFSLGSAYSIDRQIFETDPGTGSAWLATSLNNSEFGPNCVS